MGQVVEVVGKDPSDASEVEHRAVLVNEDMTGIQSLQELIDAEPEADSVEKVDEQEVVNKGVGFGLGLGLGLGDIAELGY